MHPTPLPSTGSLPILSSGGILKEPRGCLDNLCIQDTSKRPDHRRRTVFSDRPPLPTGTPLGSQQRQLQPADGADQAFGVIVGLSDLRGEKSGDRRQDSSGSCEFAGDRKCRSRVRGCENTASLTVPHSGTSGVSRWGITPQSAAKACAESNKGSRRASLHAQANDKKNAKRG